MTQALAAYYRIRPRYQRSARLDADLDDPIALEGYALHASAWEILERVATQVSATRQRAYTWTGPYGSGKSSLALLLNALLGPSYPVRERACNIIGTKRARKLKTHLPASKRGWLTVRVVGQRKHSAALIGEALQRAISERWPTRKPAQLTRQIDTNDDQEVIARLIEAGQNAARQGDGLLLIVDEMGKLLEHVAETGGDLSFFQDLAERFARADGICIFIGILHQAFQEYGALAGHIHRDEWAKVQGRFVDIPFSVAIEEVVTLVGAAIEGPPRTNTSRRCAKMLSVPLSPAAFPQAQGCPSGWRGAGLCILSLRCSWDPYRDGDSARTNEAPLAFSVLANPVVSANSSKHSPRRVVTLTD